MIKEKEVWLSGYYDPALINNWKEFQESWSMGGHAKANWIWFEGYYSQGDVHTLLSDKEYVKKHRKAVNRGTGE